jgi:hypothetical protein
MCIVCVVLNVFLQVDSLSAYLIAEQKKSKEVLAAMKTSYDEALTARRDEFSDTISKLREEVRRLEASCVEAKLEVAQEKKKTPNNFLEKSATAAALPSGQTSSPTSSAMKSMGADELHVELAAALEECRRMQGELWACEAEKADIASAYREFKTGISDREHQMGVEYSTALSNMQKSAAETEDLLLTEKANVRALVCES